MLRHKWTNRIVPPLVLIGVIGCVWYSVSSQPKAITVIPNPTAAASPVHTNEQSTPAAHEAEVIASYVPRVNKTGTLVRFSLVQSSLVHVQKVEFYVENKLVGAAYAAPYQVSVDESHLAAGTHSVTAKVYTGSSTTQTTPALFTANPSSPTPEVTLDEEINPPMPSLQGKTLVEAPTNLQVQASSDGTTAGLAWTSDAEAVSFQIWRDGTQLATTPTTTYTDTDLTPGQTYDYSIVAVTAEGSLSSQSVQAGVTMPVPVPAQSQQSQSAAAAPNSVQESPTPSSEDQ